MKTVNSISGGKTSAYIAVHYPADYEVFSLVCIDDKRCAPNDKSLIQYINAKLEKYTDDYGEFIATAEDDRTLVALRDLEQFIGREIVWVRGKSFDEVLSSPSFFGGKPTVLPSWARRYCTTEMKLLPIFQWWFNEVGEKVKMRLGFRFDEFARMENFLNKSTGFTIPVSCSTKGQRLQRHEKFDWRFCTFPLVRDIITKAMIDDYWRKNGYVGADTLFENKRKIEFPLISNCVGCFHKKPETLAIMYALNERKMNWFAKQEGKGMGTWLDSKVPYAEIGRHASTTPYIEEMLSEFGAACDSGGCTD